MQGQHILVHLMHWTANRQHLTKDSIFFLPAERFKLRRRLPIPKQENQQTVELSRNKTGEIAEQGMEFPLINDESVKMII